MISDDDPFAEPTDTEKTVVNLRPGGRSPAPAPPPPQPQAAPVASAPAAAASAPSGQAQAVDVRSAGTGLNPLNAA
ncbi:MAG: type VI secretion system protein TssL, partial [Pseudomonadota bacterium]